MESLASVHFLCGSVADHPQQTHNGRAEGKWIAEPGINPGSFGLCGQHANHHVTPLLRPLFGKGVSIKIPRAKPPITR